MPRLPGSSSPNKKGAGIYRRQEKKRSRDAVKRVLPARPHLLFAMGSPQVAAVGKSIEPRSWRPVRNLPKNTAKA
jgi:hypothetical protein